MTGTPVPDAPARLPRPPRTTRWDAITWSTVIAEVHRLQRRIAKAVQEGKHRKAQALQWLLTHSWYAKLLAVKRVTTNKGKRTPGVDGRLWTTPEAKIQAAQQLTRRGYHPQPLRRVHIRKKNGKLRPLGIPTMRDRAMQALHLFALAPVAETQADLNSYGFRLYRGCADAIEQAFTCLAQRRSGTHILEGDIKACFDRISHAWLLDHVLMDRRILRQWLAAGYVWQGELFPTTAGTPQGGIISPTLANIALDGLEACIHQAASPRKAHLIRYADDFLVIAHETAVLYVDNEIAHALCRRERRLNPKMGTRAIWGRYFTRGIYGSPRRSNPSNPKLPPGKLLRAAHIPIVRHIKIRAKANPFAQEDTAYFALRRDQRKNRRQRNARATFLEDDNR